MTAAIRAISVDVDGTLYRVRRLRVAWRLRWERGLLVALVAAREKMRHEGRFADHAALLAREAELVAPSFGLDAAQAEARLAALRAALPSALTEGVPPYPGVKSALEAASARGLALAVISDYEPGEKLRYLGLADLPFRVVIGADACGALKPHPECFWRVAKALNIEPRELLHVGDREDLDVDGALAAGCRAWRFSRRADTQTRAERLFDRWGVDLFAPLFVPSSP